MEGRTDPAASRPGGRPSTQLFVKQEGRKPLFASSNASMDDSSTQKRETSDSAKPELPLYRPPQVGDGSTLTRRINPESPLSSRRESSSSLASPGSSRIPKPTSAFSQRKPLSLAEALKMAENEEERGGDDDHQSMDASPSPAPRSWRTRRDADQNSTRQQLGEDPLDAKSRDKLPSGKAGNSNEADPTSGDVGGENGPQKIGSRVVETGRELNKVTGNERASWRDRSDWRSRPKTGSEWFKELGSSKEKANGGAGIPDLVPGIEDMQFPSVEGEEQKGAPGSHRRQTSTTAKNASPEKSFAWQIDEDFTAGDLQVSDSPRIKVDNRPFANRLPFDENSEVDINSRTRVNNPGSQNTKLDEIRSREVKTGNNIPIDSSRSRSRNTKLDDIRARETEVEEQIPIPSRQLTTSRNTKLDDIRHREAEGLTKRQLASARLEEIREQNAMPRSKSPEEGRQTPSPQATRYARKTTGMGAEARNENRAGSKWDAGGERIPDTPVTIFKGRRAKTGGSDGDAATARNGQKNEGDTARPGFAHKRADSRDLLRQLARAASSSPAAEPQAKDAPAKDAPATNRRTERSVTSGSMPITRSARRALTTPNITGARRANNNREGRASGKGNSRPTVEFAPLRRIRSTESTGSKRSSVHSEMDPTDRIEAEMKLFAPLDNHSEKGSVRAPSPASGSKKDEGEEAEVDVTPKPRKEDPLSIPTPRVVGAYVETPATIKVERIQESGIDEAASHRDDATPTTTVPLVTLRDKRSRRDRDRDTASEPGEDEKPSAITSPAAVRRPRSQSLPRHRPPLKNTAKLPSVKDDLLELQQMYNIDDTTLDNLEEVISGRKPASPKLKALLQDLPAVAPYDDDSFDHELDHMKEQSELGDSRPIKPRAKSVSSAERDVAKGDLAAYERMSKSLRTGLLGIRSAKEGIERLEDNLSHTNHQPPKTAMDTETHTHTNVHKHNENCLASTAHTDTNVVTYIYLPVPRLYSLQPRFRLTLFGILTLLAFLWYTLETTMCGLYCPPTSCTSTPCVWSYDDPTFGTALPVKLDQWTTGGLGRIVVNNALEEAKDWTADMLDMAYGRDISEIDVEGLSFEGKRAHRRRLRKKGLDTRVRKAQQDAGPEVRARWDAWHRERIAREKARDYKAMGYEPAEEDNESIGGDQRVW